MKIRWHGMLGTQHSWAFTQQYLARAMMNIGGHDLFLRSTNNLEHFPDDLKQFLIPGYHGSLTQGEADYVKEDGTQIKVIPKAPLPELADKNFPYDLELAYTIFYQSPRRFFQESKCRAIIWNFESSILPKGWHLYHRAVDYFLPSSQYSYDIFAQNGIPKDKMLVVPHGVDTNMFNPSLPPIELKTKKKVKFLHNAIPHHRKLHKRMIRTYLNTFSGDDDVCLILKTKFLTPSKDKPFEVDVREILEREFKKRKNPPEIEVINTFIPNIGSLYTACDAVVSISSCEGFWLPGLEALACGSLVIAPRHGGQLDFLNNDNSLLINTGEMKAPKSMQYWTFEESAVVGDPDEQHFSELLRRVYENPENEKNRIKESAEKTVKKFTWEAAAQMILDLPIPERSKRFHPKKKVLYIIPYNMAGGGEVWVKEAIRRLDRDIYEPHVVLVSGANPALLSLFGLKKVENENQTLLINESDVIFEYLEDQGKGKALKCLVESENYSIIHFYNSFGVYNILREAWRQGLRCRIVETIHSELSWPDSMMKVGARENLVLMKMAVSNMMARKLLKNGNKNVVVVSQHTDWNRFQVERSKDILDEFNIPKDFVVGYVGRLSPEKNLPTLLRCAKILPNISFVIVGDGPQKQPLKQIAAELKNVFFVGQRNDIEKFYAAFDVLMLPSLMEGMPLVILEAMATGTPVIASNVGAVSEIVNDGLTGFLVWNPSAYQLFAQNISKLANKNLWNQCSNNCKIVAKAAHEKSSQQDINYFYNMLFREGK